MTSDESIAGSLLKLRSLSRRVLVRLVTDVGWERKGEVKAGLHATLPCMRESLQVNQPYHLGFGSVLSGAKREVS